MNFYVSACSNVGYKRQTNEDNLYVNGCFMQPLEKSFEIVSTVKKEGVFAVCDGMGGTSFGEDASFYVVSEIKEHHNNILSDDINDQQDAVDVCIETANEKICDEMQKRNVKMGSTLALVFIKEGRANAYNIGDSKILLYRSGSLEQISLDHTVAQQKVSMGIWDEKKASESTDRHVLTQHLGIPKEDFVINPYQTIIDIQTDDILLICSDGLTDMCSFRELKSLFQNSHDTESISKALMQSALNNGGSDNISIITLKALR